MGTTRSRSSSLVACSEMARLSFNSAPQPRIRGAAPDVDLEVQGFGLAAVGKTQRAFVGTVKGSPVNHDGETGTTITLAQPNTEILRQRRQGREIGHAPMIDPMPGLPRPESRFPDLLQLRRKPGAIQADQILAGISGCRRRAEFSVTCRAHASTVRRI